MNILGMSVKTLGVKGLGAAAGLWVSGNYVRPKLTGMAPNIFAGLWGQLAIDGLMAVLGAAAAAKVTANAL